MNLGYYPGCSLTGTGKEYDLSLRAVLAALDVNLREIDDWVCCGATSAHATNHDLAVALPLLSLTLAADQGMEELLAPCAACYNRLNSAQHAVQHDEKIRVRVQNILNAPVPPRIPVLSILDLLARLGDESLRAHVVKPLSGLRVACYYGCLLVRPNTVLGGEDEEAPVLMERLVATTGAEAVEWNFRTECCGAAQAIAHPEIVVDLSKRILDDARAHGAEAVVVACPMCHSNLDTRQTAMKKRARESNQTMKEIPILYLTELLGLAFGIDESTLGLGMHLTEARGLHAHAAQEVTA